MAQKSAGATANGDSVITACGGWTRATSAAKQRIIGTIDGLEKCGKDNFALTSPGPIGVLSLDLGLDGVVQKFQDKKEIWVAEHRVNVNKLKTECTMAEAAAIASEAWANIMRDYAELLVSGAKTAIIDTGTELWEILRMARFGKLEQVLPRHYGPVNAEFKELIRAAYDTDMNMWLLHKMKDEYANDKRTGDLKRSGMSDIGYLVQVAVRCWRDDSEKFPDCFHVTVTDCRKDPSLHTFDMQGTMASVATLGQLMFPETSEEEWS